MHTSMKERTLSTLCVQVAFGVNARLIKARDNVSDEVALKREVFRDDIDKLNPLVAVDELMKNINENKTKDYLKFKKNKNKLQ